MEISEVRIKLVLESRERLRAFCSITLDGDFVIRDLKIIDGVSGPFVAMPSRKLADRCPRCGCKNHLRAKFCNDCGLKLNENRAPKDAMGRAKLHADVAHPINAGCRERIQTAVVKAYEAELERSKSPDYKPPVYDDFGDDDVTHLVEEEARRTAPRPAPPPAVAAAATIADADDGGEGDEPVARPPARPGEAPGAFSDYNSLIADLKREAAGRNVRDENAYTPPPEDEPAEPAEVKPDRGNERSDRGGREAGPRPAVRNDRPAPREDRGRRDDRGGNRGERGARPQERPDERRGGPRDDRSGVRRDTPPDQMESAPPPPPKAPTAPKPPPAPKPLPAADEPTGDDFAAGL